MEASGVCIERGSSGDGGVEETPEMVAEAMAALGGDGFCRAGVCRRDGGAVGAEADAAFAAEEGGRDAVGAVS